MRRFWYGLVYWFWLAPRLTLYGALLGVLYALDLAEDYDGYIVPDPWAILQTNTVYEWVNDFAEWVNPSTRAEY